jgi:hypothetical protein
MVVTFIPLCRCGKPAPFGVCEECRGRVGGMKRAEEAHCEYLLHRAMQGDRSDKAAPHAYMDLDLAEALANEAYPKDADAAAGLEWFRAELAKLRPLQEDVGGNPGESDEDDAERRHPSDSEPGKAE